MCHGDDGRGQGQIVGIAQHIGDETAIDLDPIDRYAPQVTQTGEAGAEIVQSDLHAHRTQTRE
jgi:hypothetical protein